MRGSHAEQHRTLAVRGYTALVERDVKGYGAHVPALPGVFTCGDSIEELEANLAEAIDLHIEGLRDAGEAVPEPR